ncbi:hypothetical protein ACFWN7_12125 [Agromyces sp. NPDC058484]|uniref:hypothetical protein n=1 Tax=Agromyces sp. NPDC058484 TaxID=3346524 RepID=UPI003654069E
MGTQVMTIEALEAETAELLPRRETLYLDFDINVAPVVGVNIALAINAATIGSVANAGAWQDMVVVQY